MENAQGMELWLGFIELQNDYETFWPYWEPTVNKGVWLGLREREWYAKINELCFIPLRIVKVKEKKKKTVKLLRGWRLWSADKLEREPKSR